MSDTPLPKEKRREIQENRQAEYEQKIHAASNVTAEDHSEAEVERVADAVLTATEAREAVQAGLSAREFIRAEYDGVEPSDYPTDNSLQAALSASRRGETVEASQFVSSDHRDRRSQRDSDAEAEEPPEDEIEAMAEGVLTTRELQAAENMGGPAALIKSEYGGVDPADHYPNEQDLMAAMSKARRHE